MDTAEWALLVSLFSLVVAFAAAIAQVAQHVLTGSRVSVDMRLGLLTVRGALIRASIEGWVQSSRAATLAHIRDDDVWIDVGVITVTNTGRTATSVRDVGLWLSPPPDGSDSLTLRPFQVQGGEPDGTVVRLDGGESKWLIVPLGPTIKWGLLNIDGDVLTIRGRAVKVSGKAEISPQLLEIRVHQGTDHLCTYLGRSKQVEAFEILMKHWESTSLTGMYEAWLSVWGTYFAPEELKRDERELSDHLSGHYSNPLTQGLVLVELRRAMSR